jgi:diguanylate cyclase (GGDEF)-like protein
MTSLSISSKRSTPPAAGRASCSGRAGAEPVSIENRIWQASHHDALTGLANRALLVDRCTRAMRRARLGGPRMALLVLGIDRFKGINDSLGHAVGDWFLRTGADRIRAALDSTTTVARTGGDEFAILLEGLRDREESADIARRLAAAVAEPAPWSTEAVVVTTSVGIAFYPGAGADATTLLCHADIAMARAKAEGGNAVRFYDAAMSGRSVRAFTLHQRLHHALVGEQLALHYQPIVQLDDMKLRGMEALMRWTQSDGSSVSPGEFIPVAEQSGLIQRLGDYALRRACGQIAAWRDAGFATVPVSINVSPRQLSHADITDSLLGTLDECGIAPESVQLEITETSAMCDDDDAVGKLRRLADRGLRVAIDDFGIGYSSLSRLQKLPVHTLKIDRIFTSELRPGAPVVAVVAAIVTLARALGLETVAEGVETHEQLQMLQSLGCDRCQGYLISRPVAGAEAGRLLGAPADPTLRRHPAAAMS